ncbi:MAG: HAD-IIA family hydrolase [Acidimicrobiales bacterium]
MPAWVLDLDGVVWLGEEPIVGAAAAVGRLRSRGMRVLLVTNNSSATIAEYLSKLERVGVTTSRSDLLTSAQAAANLVEPGSTALVCAGPGVAEALLERGVKAVRDGPADTVVVGWHRDFDYERLTVAARAVRGGARLIGTNDDATYPTPEGPIPGGGAILAAVATASGVEPVVAGKPHDAMVELVHRSLFSSPAPLRPPELGELVAVGDRPSTDGVLARRLGARFGLVLSGVTKAADLPVEPSPDMVAADLAELVAQELGSQELA